VQWERDEARRERDVARQDCGAAKQEIEALREEGGRLETRLETVQETAAARQTQEIEALRDEGGRRVASQSQEIEALRDESGRRVASHQQEIEALRDESGQRVASQQQEIEALRDESGRRAASHQQEIDELRDACAGHEARHRSAEEERRTLEVAYGAVERANKSLTGGSEQLEEEVMVLRGQSRHSAHAVTEASREAEMNRSAVEHLRSEVSELREQLDEAVQLAASAEREAGGARRELTESRGQLRSAQNRSMELEQTCRDIGGELATLRDMAGGSVSGKAAELASALAAADEAERAGEGHKCDRDRMVGVADAEKAVAVVAAKKALAEAATLQDMLDDAIHGRLLAEAAWRQQKTMHETVLSELQTVHAEMEALERAFKKHRETERREDEEAGGGRGGLSVDGSLSGRRGMGGGGTGGGGALEVAGNGGLWRGDKVGDEQEGGEEEEEEEEDDDLNDLFSARLTPAKPPASGKAGGKAGGKAVLGGTSDEAQQALHRADRYLAAYDRQTENGNNDDNDTDEDEEDDEDDDVNDLLAARTPGGRGGRSSLSPQRSVSSSRRHVRRRSESTLPAVVDGLLHRIVETHRGIITELIEGTAESIREDAAKGGKGGKATNDRDRELTTRTRNDRDSGCDSDRDGGGGSGGGLLNGLSPVTKLAGEAMAELDAARAAMEAQILAKEEEIDRLREVRVVHACYTSMNMGVLTGNWVH
jgi:hypothetical protein